MRRTRFLTFLATLAVSVGLTAHRGADARSPDLAKEAASEAAKPVAARSTAPKTSEPRRTPGRLRAIVPPGPPASIMPLSQVRAGMVGQALTVFTGTKPEPFKVRVVAILRNFLPKQDVILIRAEDERVEKTGIVAGMSGSPVYVDGKLMGAIAYAWTFSKEPLGGVTPIEAMLAERSRPRRTKGDVMALAQADTPAATPADASSSGAASSSGDAPSALVRGLGLPPLLPTGSEPRLQRASVPLSVSGFGARAVAELDESLRPLGLVPVQAGGGRRAGVEGPGRVEPGSAIGVELIRGDMSTVGTGTVTHVDGDAVFAFGHPMLGIGELYLPLVDAEIHTFLPSLAQSFKMSSPLHEVGALVQDRPACIIGDLGVRTPMIPVEVRVSGAGAEGRTFRAEVARNRRLTPILTSMVVGNAIANAEPDVADMVVTVSSRVDVKGQPALELRDQIFTSEGVSGRTLASSRGLRALGELLSNPFEPVTVERLDVDVQVEYRRDVADIIAVSLPGDVVRAGDTVPLRVTLRPYAGDEYVETIPVKIPRTVAGSQVKIEVASGALVRPETAPAEDLVGFMANLRKFYTASSVVVSLQTPDDGASLRGRLLAGLPSSAMDTLRPGNRTRRGDTYRVADRTIHPVKRLVNGKQEMSIFVREDSLGRNR